MVRLRRSDPEAWLPLKPAHYLLLVVLADGDCHAYALKKEVALRTDGRVRLGPGTLHRALGWLLEATLVEESPDRPARTLDDERRRYYRLTPLGRRVAAAETERLAALVAAARGRLTRREPIR
ncbi:MAG TPA: helix-turn-helix transcriptional regulator [Haliangiales bacterium]|nr:helix-turn-helix transcriptional regulator [Haliangiales bacterium]